MLLLTLKNHCDRFEWTVDGQTWFEERIFKKLERSDVVILRASTAVLNIHTYSVPCGVEMVVLY